MDARITKRHKFRRRARRLMDAKFKPPKGLGRCFYECPSSVQFNRLFWAIKRLFRKY